jgi:TolB-like protein
MVFISYARADRPKVAPLADVLAARGHDVWWDALIEGGTGFATMIEAKLQAADAVVVVWSATSVMSDWVRDEAAHARDRKRIVPVTIDGTEAPLGFRQYHMIDLSKWHGRADAPDVERVVAGIAAVQTGMPVAFAPTAGRIDRRKALMLGGAGVAVIGGGMVVFNPFRASSAANSVAVLPFANLSADKDQAYFSDGLSEEIRSTLARNPALNVAAPTSANTFRDKTADAKVIGSKLGVAFLLEGSVRRAGDVVRIAAELVDAKTGFSKWSQSFDRKLTDVFAVQSEIAGVVASALATSVTGVAKTIGGTTNVAAYDAFLQGRALYNLDGGEVSDHGALVQFEAAIAADPNYAAAYAARSRTLATIASQYAKATELRGLYDAAIASAQRAVALAPRLADAQLAFGYALVVGRLDVRAARVPYDRAAALGAGDADILIQFAIYCSRTLRKNDAIKAAMRAISLDRLNPRAFRSAGLVQYAARNYLEAIGFAQKALGISNNLRNANGHIGNSLLMLDKLSEARASYLAEKSDLLRLPGLAIVEQRLGNQSAAQKSLDELVSSAGDSALYQQAQVQAQWGNTEKSLAALGGAKALGDSGLLIVLIDPLLDPLRNNPKFAELITSLKL